MAAQAANAATATPTSVGAASNLLGRECRRLWVRCESASPESISVRVQNDKANDHIHGDSDKRVLAAGEEQVYDASVDNKIADLRIFSAGGAGTYSYESTAT